MNLPGSSAGINALSRSLQCLNANWNFLAVVSLILEDGGRTIGNRSLLVKKELILCDQDAVDSASWNRRPLRSCLGMALFCSFLHCNQEGVRHHHPSLTMPRRSKRVQNQKNQGEDTRSDTAPPPPKKEKAPKETTTRNKKEESQSRESPRSF